LNPSFWSNLPLNRQLLISVNSVLLVIVGSFLLVDHRWRIERELYQKEVSLSEEAKTVYESVVAVEDQGEKAIQSLLDAVCARMNLGDSPGHHIAVKWRGKALQSASHGQASPDMFAAMQQAAGRGPGPSAIADSLVIGVFFELTTEVYISETRSVVLENARRSLAVQLLAVLTAGAIATFVVNFVLRRVVSSPIATMVTAIKSVSSGDMDVVADSRSCQELSFLADQINSMTRSLNAAEQDRRAQMDKARRIQRHLLPEYDGIRGFQVAELFEPAEEVGGDYYDVIPLEDDRFLLCIADVSGHGVPAAMAATVIKSLVLESVQFSQSPAEILARINRRYTEVIMVGHFATMVVLVLDVENGSLAYANAGHEPPFIQRPGQAAERLTVGDLVLGVDETVNYSEVTIRIERETVVVLVSDGVTEAFDPLENQFGVARIEEVMRASCGVPVEKLVERFSEALTQFRKSRPPFDDTTLLVAKLTSD